MVVEIVRYAVLDFLGQLKASSKFARGDCANVGMTNVVELNSKKLLKDVVIGTVIVWWVEAVREQN